MILEVAPDRGGPPGRVRAPARGLEQGSVVQARALAAGERVALVPHKGVFGREKRKTSQPPSKQGQLPGTYPADARLMSG